MSIRRIISRIGAEPRPIRFLASRVLWRLGISRFFVARRNGYRVRFHPSAVSAAVWADPAHLNPEEEFVAARLRAGETYVDVGANVGLLTMRAASVVGPRGRVIAIEAHPRTHRFLEDNLRLSGLDGRVQAIHRAVGEAPGMLTFTDFMSDDQNHVSVDGAGMLVPVERLDDLVPAGPVALLKVDVEGFELQVFRGAPAVLERTRAVLFESWDHHAARFGNSAAAVVALLRSSGFTVHRLEGRELRPFGDDDGSPGCENLVALRD